MAKLWRWLTGRDSDLVTASHTRPAVVGTLVRTYPKKYRAFISLTGASGSNATTPDTAVLDVTGDIDVRVKLRGDVSPATQQCLLAKWTESGNLRAYRLRMDNSRRLRFATSNNGTNERESVATADTTLKDNQIGWVRATLDVNDGGGNRVTTFYYRVLDDDDWTQIGDPVTVAQTTTIVATTSVLEIGSTNAGTALRFIGSIYRAQVYDGIDGTLVFDADFSTALPGAGTLTDSENDLVITLNGTPGTAIREENG